MRVFDIKGFDNKANILLNDAISCASEAGCNELNTAHFLYIMLNNIKSLADSFTLDTSIEPEVYLNAFKKLYTNTNDGVRTSIGVQSMTIELKQVISSELEKASINHRLVSVTNLYHAILLDKECKAWEVLEFIGIDTAKIEIKIDINPLESMPTTQQFGVNYNILAKQGRFDPIEARDDVIDSLIEVMGRRIKNNPCLIGDSGVGKTAIVEGLAQRLVDGNVPKYLKGKHIICIDISAVVSGSKFRGEFEERLNKILYEAASNEKVVLFFDEIHMLSEAGASSSESSMTAANMLKPAISRGDVQIIGATTPTEYKKFIESDKAFERRLQKVDVTEPTVENAIKMVHAVIGEYNKFHNSMATDEAIIAAVKLSDRYITDKKLPDKAITVIDETAARLKKTIDTDSKIVITEADIKNTVSKLSGVDVTDLDDTSKIKLNSLSDRLKKHVVGQDKAVECISKSIRRSKAGIKDPNRPIGSFLFVGPTGVGKTELCKALAIEFGNGVKNLIRFDMSEFMEKHSVSKLIGSPPGYVGYGEGGQLTEAVRRNPYSILLFDEIEKAHPDVFNSLLQVLDEGMLTDSEGTKVDFKNTVIIMTSNAGYGANMMNKSNIGFGSIQVVDDPDKNEKIAMKALESTFRPEFLNRIDKVVIFDKLSKEVCRDIVGIIMNQLKKRLADNNISISWDSSLVDHIIETGYSEKYGARNIKRKVSEVVEDILADKIIDDDITSGDNIILSYDENTGLSVEKNLISVLMDKLETIEA